MLPWRSAELLVRLPHALPLFALLRPFGLQGDGIDYHNIKAILDALLAAGYSAEVRTAVRMYSRERYMRGDGRIHAQELLCQHLDIGAVGPLLLRRYREEVAMLHPASACTSPASSGSMLFIRLFTPHDDFHIGAVQCVAFGMGGGLLQRVNRDTLSLATKLSHIVYQDGTGELAACLPIFPPCLLLAAARGCAPCCACTTPQEPLLVVVRLLC